MTEKMKIALLAIVAIIVIVLVDLTESHKSIEKYNNGYCKECGTKYETSYAIDEGQKYIVYKCPHCYKMGNINVYFAE